MTSVHELSRLIDESNNLIFDQNIDPDANKLRKNAELLKYQVDKAVYLSEEMKQKFEENILKALTLANKLDPPQPQQNS